MKSVVTAFCLLIPLVIIFVIIDHKDFYSGDDVAIQQETVMERKPTTVAVLKPVEKPMETKPVEVKPVETKPVETKSVKEGKPGETKLVAENKSANMKSAERKPVETAPEFKTKPTYVKQIATPQPTEVKSTEAKPVIETKTIAEGKLAPAAMPVATAEEAEKLNTEALEAAKPRQILASYKQKGYKNVYSTEFDQFYGIGISKQQEVKLTEKGYDIHEFKKRLVPRHWSIDLSTIPSEILFQKVNEGYNIHSNKERVCILAPRFDAMKSSFFFNIEITNASADEECDIEVGINNYGQMDKGYKVLGRQKIAPGKESTVQWGIGVFDHFSSIAPSISIKGNSILKSFDVYRFDHNEFTIVEGTIQERSVLPAPESTDYPDCRYTAHFIGNSIASGLPCNKEVVLSVDGFANKTILPSNALKKNDKIKCAIVRFDSVPESISGIQEADDLNLFDLDSYLVISYEIISSFSDYSETNSGIEFSDSINKNNYVSIFDRGINPRISDELKMAQKSVINHDLKKVREMLQPYTSEKKQEINSEFQKVWDIEKSKDPPGYNRIGRVVWRNVDNSFYALPESFVIIQDYPKINQENLNSLIAFKDYLETQGIQLIVSLVPVNYDISARVINREFSILPDFRTAEVCKQLLENNIEAIYSSDSIISKYNLYENAFYFPADPHPGDLPQDVLSDILADRLKRFNFERKYPKTDFKIVRTPDTNIAASEQNRTYPKTCDIGNHKPGDFYNFNRVFYHDHNVSKDLDSPVMILGNSYSNFPEPISNYLCMKLGIGIAHYAISGSGVLSTSFHRIFNSPEKYLKNRKVLILSVGTIHLLADIRIPNLRELDLEKVVLSGKRRISSLEVLGNENIIPSFALQLDNPSLFKIGSSGSCTITDDTSIPNYNFASLKTSEDYYLVITYCCESSGHFQLEINGTDYPLLGMDNSSIYLKKVIPLSCDVKSLDIKVKGNMNSYIAIGSIQLYQ